MRELFWWGNVGTPVSLVGGVMRDCRRPGHHRYYRKNSKILLHILIADWREVVPSAEYPTLLLMVVTVSANVRTRTQTARPDRLFQIYQWREDDNMTTSPSEILVVSVFQKHNKFASEDSRRKSSIFSEGKSSTINKL